MAVAVVADAGCSPHGGERSAGEISANTRRPFGCSSTTAAPAPVVLLQLKFGRSPFEDLGLDSDVPIERQGKRTRLAIPSPAIMAILAFVSTRG